MEPRDGERIADVELTDERVILHLQDGRIIGAPLSWFPRLVAASPSQRGNWRLCGAGFGVHWPEIDEDISSSGLLRGAPAPGGKS